MSWQSKLMNLMFKMMSKKKLDGQIDYQFERKIAQERVKAVSERIHIEIIEHNGLSMEWLSLPQNKSTIFYIHGGGFTTGSAAERRDITQYLVKHCGYNTISINYRLSPENKWPCHLEDVYNWYQYLFDSGYDISNVIVMGESAGGTLSLALGLKIRDEKLPMPKGFIAFSPATNQAEGFPSHQENSKTDYMLGNSFASPQQKEAVFGERKDDLNYLSHPYVSPFYGDFSGLSPIFLSVSDTEVLYDDSVKLYEKLKRFHHPVAIDIQPNQCHAYPIFTHIPEARKTIKKALKFIEEETKTRINK